jgi:hypothetical protein
MWLMAQINLGLDSGFATIYVTLGKLLNLSVPHFSLKLIGLSFSIPSIIPTGCWGVGNINIGVYSAIVT